MASGNWPFKVVRVLAVKMLLQRYTDNVDCLPIKVDQTPNLMRMTWDCIGKCFLQKLTAQSEKYAPGQKSSKERLTVMTCSNVSGYHELKLLVIGRAKKPRSFKRTEIRSLPCDYYNHLKAWINQAIYLSWFKEKCMPSVHNCV